MTSRQETQTMPQKRQSKVNFWNLNMPYFTHRTDLFVQDQTAKPNNANNVKPSHIIWEWTVSNLKPDHWWRSADIAILPSHKKILSRTPSQLIKIFVIQRNVNQWLQMHAQKYCLAAILVLVSREKKTVCLAWSRDAVKRLRTWWVKQAMITAVSVTSSHYHLLHQFSAAAVIFSI